MFSYRKRTLTTALSILAAVVASAGVFGQSDGIPITDASSYARQLATQRREIDEIKQIFARIDSRIIQIESIHRQIEYILNNPGLAEFCITLERLRRINALIDRDLIEAVDPVERARLQADKDQYAAVFRRAEAAFQRFGCRE